MQGYYTHPTLFKDQIVFTCEEDLWCVSTSGGVARRLTAGRGGFFNAHFSADGKKLAVTSMEDGAREVFVMPAAGGPLKRLTYLGGITHARGWHQGKVLMSSWAKEPNWVEELFTIGEDGGEVSPLKRGFAIRMAVSKSGVEVIERNGWRPEASHWKRYRGGTAGKFYLRLRGKKEFTPFLRNLKGNLSSPMWIDERLYFVSDHDGIANIYSVTAQGRGLKQHTFEKDYFVRNPSVHEHRIVYHRAGELCLFDAKAETVEVLSIDINSQQTQAQHKWVSMLNQLEHYAPSPTGQAIALTSRGQVVYAPAFQGGTFTPSLQLEQRFRDRLGLWLKESKESEQVVFVSDEAGLTETESLILVDLKEPTKRKRLKANVGRVAQMKASPDGEKVGIINHRNELLVVELKTDKVHRVLHTSFEVIPDFDWSPDSNWIVTSNFLAAGKQELAVWSLKTKKLTAITEPCVGYASARFSLCGEMIFFLGTTNFNPKYENARFTLFFENLNRPYALLLKKGTPSPLRHKRELPSSTPANDSKKNEGVKEVVIDFEGIKERLVAIGVKELEYRTLLPLERGLLLGHMEIIGSRPTGTTPPPLTLTLDSFDFTTLKQKQVMSGVSGYSTNNKKDYVLLKLGEKLRLRKASDIGSEDNNDNDSHPKSGWISGERFQIPIYPRNEWAQIFQETWRLQKLFFWDQDMGGVDWEKQRRRYQRLLPRIATRTELTDLQWELIGELGVGHAYAMGGDLRPTPRLPFGFLGADYAWDKKQQGWKITKILKGYPWLSDQHSPLSLGDVAIREGEVITAVNGRLCQEHIPMSQMLMGLCGIDVNLTVSKRTITLKTLTGEFNLRYRQWVEENREKVHKLSKGKLGYVHIPDMGPDGYAEFYEQYLQEFDKDGLVIDVRFNGGGHVSQLILSKLYQKRVGVDSTRWFGVQSYPLDAPKGPMVALTNEYAGSDGDIFSHSWKLYGLGPLLGTRTWGGVIGIWPRHTLMDGGSTTQPEFAFWFTDVGWGVENYGTDPQIEVDNLPHHFEKGIDAQLEKAIAQGLQEIKRKPPFNPKLPPKPKR